MPSFIATSRPSSLISTTYLYKEKWPSPSNSYASCISTEYALYISIKEHKNCVFLNVELFVERQWGHCCQGKEFFRRNQSQNNYLKASHQVRGPFLLVVFGAYHMSWRTALVHLEDWYIL